MQRKKLVVLALLTTILPITLRGAKISNEQKQSEKVAKLLLIGDGIHPKSYKGTELLPMLAWMWRGENYKKQCNYEKLTQYHKRIVTIKTLREKYAALEDQDYPDWTNFKAYLDTVDSIDIILAFQVYQHIGDSQRFIHQIMQQLYKGLRDKKLPLKPLLKHLEKHPVAIIDLEGSHEATCSDNNEISELATITSCLLKSIEKVPFMWRARKDGAPHRLTIGNLTLITDPLNHHIELEVENKKIVSLECHEASQLVFDKDGIFACAATLDREKEGSHPNFQGALIVDFNTEHYLLIDHPCATTSDIDTKLNPQISCEKGTIVINWHDWIDILYLPTNSLSRYSQANFIESAILAPDGKRLVVHEKLPGYGKAHYVYKLIMLTRKKILLANHLTCLAPQKNPCAGTLVPLLSGIGIGKVSFGKKLISKTALTTQHKEFEELDEALSKSDDMPIGDNVV